ncbi:MAG: hypothetical protein KF802_06600 [Bdellovibrionaceae bacterium]|nr:hypothetical protein [Pseudobdellovibrionaceae bacterium]MBX3034424.1 hypothetical protein [Pseudobdellovibrionaceae bacterium]
MKPVHAILFICLAFAAIAAEADDLRIVDVRRNIPLSDDEPVYKDYYLSAGETGGLKKNLVVTAVRKITVRDANGTQTYGEMEVPVGQLRVIGVFGKIAVAREYKLLSRDDNPMLEQTGLMVGDAIEIKGSFVDDKPLSLKKKVSEVKLPAAEEAARTTASLVEASAKADESTARLMPPVPAATVVPAALPEPVASATAAPVQ